jgi:hypothetical protein
MLNRRTIVVLAGNSQTCAVLIASSLLLLLHKLNFKQWQKKKQQSRNWSR